MSKLSSLVQLGAAIGGRAVSLGEKASRVFRGNTKLMADFAAKIPALKGTRINASSVAAYVRENPVTSIFALMQIADAAELISEMVTEVPGLSELLVANDATDTVDTLTADKTKTQEKAAENMEALKKKILDMPLRAIMEFSDEAQVIDAVIDSMVGNTHVERLASLQTLRRVMQMPDSNFVMYEQFRQING